MTADRQVTIEEFGKLNGIDPEVDYDVISWNIANNLSVPSHVSWKHCILHALDDINRSGLEFDFFVVLFRRYRYEEYNKKSKAYQLQKTGIYRYLSELGVDVKACERSEEYLVGNVSTDNYGYLSLCPFALLTIKNFLQIRKHLDDPIIDECILMGIPPNRPKTADLSQEIGEILVNQNENSCYWQKWGGRAFLQAMINYNCIVFTPYSHYDEPVLSFLGIARQDIIKAILRESN